MAFHLNMWTAVPASRLADDLPLSAVTQFHRTAPRPRRRLKADNRGGIALLLALLFPGIVAALALGIEVSSWAGTKVSVQRTADLAAIAGGFSYSSSTNAQTAATAAAKMAQMNGASGAASPTWNASSQTLTSDKITVKLLSGSFNTSNTAISVTIAQDRSSWFAGMLGSATKVTIPASSNAEVIAQPWWYPVGETGGAGGTGLTKRPFACIIALSSGSSGLGFSLGGSATLDATGCAVLSNSSISISGSASAAAQYLVATGTINLGGSASVTGTQYTHAGTTRDPYASSAPVQNAIASLSPGAGQAVSVKNGQTVTIQPGTYSRWSLGGGTLNLVPGLYIVNGDINLNAQSTLTGTNVTIVTSGIVSTGGGATISLSASKNSTVNGAIPSVALIGTTSSAVTIGGGSTSALTGAIYFPNAGVTFSGHATTSNSTGCLQLVAATITLWGSPQFAPNCKVFGAPPTTINGVSDVRTVL